MDTLASSNLAQLVLHCVFSFLVKFSGGFFVCISYIVLTKDCYSLYSSSQSTINFLLISFPVLEHMFLSNFVPGIGHVNIHHMDRRIDNFRFHYKWFLCSFHSFVLKHILHINILRIVYDFVSCVTIDMTRIPHRSLYFDLLNSNSINYRNKVFLSFHYIGFNIMICPMTIYIVHSCFLCKCLRFLS